MILYQLFHLECHDIKRGLIELAHEFADTIINHLADLHKRENDRYVKSLHLLNGYNIV